MNFPRAKIVRALVDFFGLDDRRIEHAFKVLFHSEQLLEGRSDCDPEVVIACALLHDVGIRIAEEKHGRNDGPMQEEYGPPAAEGILRAVGFPEEKIGKVKDIIGNHHSASRFPYPELELLKKADLIVNRAEANG